MVKPDLALKAMFWVIQITWQQKVCEVTLHVNCIFNSTDAIVHTYMGQKRE